MIVPSPSVVTTTNVNTNVSTTQVTNLGNANFGSYIWTTRQNKKDWKVLLMRGQDVTNPYSRGGFAELRPFLFSGSDENLPVHKSRSTFRVAGTAGAGISLISYPLRERARDRALKKFKSLLDDAGPGTLNSLVPLVELKETAGLVQQLAKPTEKFVGQWGTGIWTYLLAKPKLRKRLASDLADMWLTYSFAVKPTLGEIDDHMKAAANYLLRDYNNKARLQARATEYELSRTIATAPAGSFSQNNCIKAHTMSCTTVFTGGFDFSFLTGENWGAADQFGFIPENLPSAGWELVPLSWVIDYFSTIGDYLADTFVIPPGSTTYLTESTILRDDMTLIPDIVPSATTSRVTSAVIERMGRIRYFQFSRVKLGALPRRTLRWKSLHEIGGNVETDIKRLLNLTSVIVGSVNRRHL